MFFYVYYYAHDKNKFFNPIKSTRGDSIKRYIISRRQKVFIKLYIFIYFLCCAFLCLFVYFFNFLFLLFLSYYFVSKLISYTAKYISPDTYFHKNYFFSFRGIMRLGTAQKLIII